MASSSTSSVPKSFKYDVFLSFRGEDTRNTFVDHLYNALQQKGIQTYKDDEKIKKGKRIYDDLFTSIEESRFYIIVFSKTYASSSWCLDELVKIMECQKMTEHTVYPVFYHVEPTEVRKQSGAVGEAFAKHENDENSGKWRDALKGASHLAGWEYMNNGENKFIQKIVHEILLELLSIKFPVDEKLVGMKSRVNEIVSSLETSSDDVRMFGIIGMGGVGKTTLTRAVYDKISFLFEGKSFVGNVREVSRSLLGLMTLQKQVISDVLKDQSITVSNVFDGKEHIIKSMRCRKVLVVLDDVDDKEQLEALAGDCNWFKSGSRIIITTRDKQVLISHRVLLDYDVALLSDDEAISLLSRHAFGTKTPIEGYKGLSEQVVDYAAGLPLTIKVLGSKLCGADEGIWRDIIERLKEIPLTVTQKRLEISYDDLEEEHKEIFLDVACIMKGWRKDDAIRALDSCGRHGRYGLRILELKSLITISSSYGHEYYGHEYLGMHDHIEEMGQNIVRRPYYDKPHTHSRLWKDEEIEEILAKDLGTEATCIKLKLKTNSKFDMKGLRKMENLRLLHLSSSINIFRKEVNIGYEYEDEVGQYFPDALRYLFWKNYPFHCLPNTFRAKNLVRIEMPCYESGQLWESGGREVLEKLKFLVIPYSRLTTLNLGVTPNLETLNLLQSFSLEELHVPKKLQKLKSLTVTCSVLKSFDLGKTPNLETLDLSSSLALQELHIPDKCSKLGSLSLGFINMKSFDLVNAAKLETLWLEKHPSLNDDDASDESHKSLHLGCPNLSTIDLRGSLNLKELHVELYDYDDKSNANNLLKLHMPNELRVLNSLYLRHPMLRSLDLGRTPKLEPSSLEGHDESEDNHMVFKCPTLQNLDLYYSQLKTLNLEMNTNLETVYIESAALVQIFGLASELKFLTIIGSKNLETLDLWLAVNLESLQLRNCQDLVKLDMPVKQSKLRSLHIDGSQLSTFDLGLAPNLDNLFLRDSPELVEVHMHVGYPKLGSLTFRRLPKLRTLDFAMTLNLKDLSLEGCKDLVLKMPLKFPKLETLRLKSCSMLKTLMLQTPSLKSLVTETYHLTDVMLSDCPKLKELSIIRHVQEVRLYLDGLGCLENLTFTSAEIKHLPDSICMLQHLKSLIVRSCHLLEKLPENLDCLECLESLRLLDCESLQDIPSNIGKLKRLQELSLHGCTAVKKLPEELGSLEYLKLLNIYGTAITHLPESIVLFKDLHIRGSKSLLESCKFSSEEDTRKYETFYHRGNRSRSLLFHGIYWYG